MQRRASSASPASYVGRRPCPVCGKLFAVDALAAHADRCCAKTFSASASAASSSSSSKKQQQQQQQRTTTTTDPAADDDDKKKPTIWAERSTNPDTPLVVTFRHLPEARSFFLFSLCFWLL
ncbi:MAG: hypothetical protein AAF645_09450 [Myxococcota bacterium]